MYIYVCICTQCIFSAHYPLSSPPYTFDHVYRTSKYSLPQSNPQMYLDSRWLPPNQPWHCHTFGHFLPRRLASQPVKSTQCMPSDGFSPCSRSTVWHCGSQPPEGSFQLRSRFILLCPVFRVCDEPTNSVLPFSSGGQEQWPQPALFSETLGLPSATPHRDAVLYLALNIMFFFFNKIK